MPRAQAQAAATLLLTHARPAVLKDNRHKRYSATLIVDRVIHTLLCKTLRQAHLIWQCCNLLFQST
jgi:hypothetical protein